MLSPANGEGQIMKGDEMGEHSVALSAEGNMRMPYWQPVPANDHPGRGPSGWKAGSPQPARMK